MSKSRKELNENELAGAITDQFDHIKPHLPKILIGFATIAAIVFGINYMMSSRSAAKEAKAINLVLFGVENSAAGSLATLDKQIEDFPDDMSTAWAYLLKGDRELTSGLEKIFVDKLTGRDFINRAKKDFEQADQLANDNENIKQRALFGWARSLESLGQFDDAAAKYSELVKMGESPFATLAEKGIARVNNPDNREFFDLFNQKGKNSLEVTTTESAPPTNSGLPARPDFTYPGEEPVEGSDIDSESAPGETPGGDEKGTGAKAKNDASPAPPEDVIGGKKDESQPAKKGDEDVPAKKKEAAVSEGSKDSKKDEDPSAKKSSEKASSSSEPKK